MMPWVAAAHDADAAHAKWQSWWEVGGYAGTDERSRGEVTLFQVLEQSPGILVFADIRSKLFEHDIQEGNFAIGWRQRRSGWNLGAWAGFDIRSSEEDNLHAQFAAGVEALTPQWDVRLNGYMPVTGLKGTPGTARVFLRGNRILMTGGAEMAMHGVDGEIGLRLMGRDSRHGLHVFGGGYWYDGEDADREIAGLRTRLEYRINDVIARLSGSRFTLDVGFSHDEVRDETWEIGARLRIPLGAPDEPPAHRLSALDGRMTERIERDTDIVVGMTGEEPVDDDRTDVQMNRVAFADGGTGLPPAIGQGGETLIIAQGGNGTITGDVDLQANQTLQGGGSTIPMRGRRTGTVAGFTAPGATPFVQFGGNEDVIGVQGSNVHIAGLTVDGLGQTSDEGIDIFSGKTNIVIEQTTVQNVGDKGIDLDDDNSNIRIFNNTVVDSVTDGVSMDDRNSNVTISDMTIRNSGRDGIYTDDDNTDLVIERVTIDTAGFHGIDIGFDNIGVTIRDSSITGADDAGILVFDGNRNVSISNTSISNSATEAIRIEVGNSVTMSGVTFNGAGDDGLQIIGFNTVTMTGSTFTGTFVDDAIDIGPFPNTLGGDGNMFNGVATTFCEVAGIQTGRFGFPGGPSNCPP